MFQIVFVLMFFFIQVKHIIKYLLLVKHYVRGYSQAVCSSRDSRLLRSNQIINWQHTELFHPLPRQVTLHLIGWFQDTSTSAAAESDWPSPIVSVSGGKWSFLSDILTPWRGESSRRLRRRALHLYQPLQLPRQQCWCKIWKCGIGDKFAVAFITHWCHYQRTLISIQQQIT